MRAPARSVCQGCEQTRSGVMARVDPEMIARFEQDKLVQTLREGQTLFCEGGPTHSVYCVRSGLFKLFKTGIGGQPLVLRFAGPGSSLGIRAAIAHEPHEETAEAMVESMVCTFPLATFDDCMRGSATMAIGMMRRLAVELRQAHERMMELAQCDVMQRAARLLLGLQEQHERAEHNGPVRLTRPRHVDLAAMIGTTPESLSRVLHTLREREVIEVTRDAIRIKQPARLRAIARLASESE